MFDYLLKKLQDKINSVSSDSNSVEEGAVVNNEAEEGAVNFVEEKEPLKLTPQQLAQAKEFLGSIAGMTLEESKQTQLALQMAATKVPDEERPILEYILAKLTVRIAELEAQTDKILAEPRALSQPAETPPCVSTCASTGTF